MKTNKLLLICALLICGAIMGQSRYIYVSDAGGFNVEPWQVLRYDEDGSNPQVFIDNQFFVDNSVGWPQDILFLEDQEVVLISCLVGGRITKHNATTGAYLEDFATVAGGPTRMKIGADGYIYVLQWSNTDNKVLRFEQDGTFVDEFTSVGVSQSIGLDWDSDGYLYVSSYGGSSVRMFDTEGMDMGLFIDSELGGPTNIHFNDQGELIVLDWSQANVERFAANGDYLGEWTNGINQVEGLDVHPDTGNYFLGAGALGRIDEFTPDGTFVQTVVESGSGGLIQPNAVIFRDAILSVPDFDKEQAVLVMPTLGNQFNWINQTEFRFEEAHIMNLSGAVIDTLKLSEQTNWNASNRSNGIYFVVAVDELGNRRTQKIVVKNR